jgi:hypothetical protein
MTQTDLLDHDVDGCSDADLVAGVGDALAEPRAASADSFVLHSALELLARAALLPFIDPGERPRARARFGELSAQFRAFGQPVAPPATAAFDSVPHAASRLIEALARGELDDIDTAADWLGRHATPMQLRATLADALVPSLAAAAHAPIFLYLFARVAPRGETTGRLLRQLARELGRHPSWTMTWFRARAEGETADADAITAALVDVPRLPEPVSTFIHPLMSRIDDADHAARWLDGVTCGAPIDERAKAVLRVAAWSMVGEPTHHAPYGWSHCLTMPQAVLGIAGSCTDPSIALAVAATHVAGFRTLADGPIRTQFDAPDPGVPITEAIGAGPYIAAAAAWHGDHRAVQCALATHASTHHDAHLVKYTLACLDAAADDPSSRPLFLAAAASLAGWWATTPG